MKGLFKILPPFAPDYSGVCSVLFNLGGVVVVHDAGGCTGNITGYDEPRWYGNNSAIFSSELREIDAVLGDDEKLVKKIENAANSMERNFIALMGSPAPMVIGEDYQALGRILEKRTGLPVLTFDTNGIKYYDTGVSMAFMEMARCFVEPASEGKKALANIIGATTLDMGQEKNVKDIVALLLKAGFKNVCCWGMDATMEDIAGSARAALNVVVARSGLAAALFMEIKYGIPYLLGVPIGCGPTEEFVNNAASVLGAEKMKETEPIVRKVHDARSVLVIGEQVMSNSIRKSLRMDMGIEKVDVASFFTMNSELMEEGDMHLEQEDDLTALSKKGNYDLLIGDPLYRELLELKEDSRFIEFPHIALSSRLYWDKSFEYIGDAGLNLFKNYGKAKRGDNYYHELLNIQENKSIELG